MPTILSRTMNDIHFEIIKPGKVIKNIEAVIRVVGELVFKTKDGRLYWSRNQNACYVAGMWPWAPAMMRALVKLGIITRKEAEEHLRECKERDDARNREYDMERIRVSGTDARRSPGEGGGEAMMCRKCAAWWLFPWVCGPDCKIWVVIEKEGK